MPLRQGDPDQDGPPGGMFATQGQGGLAGLVGIGMGQGSGPVIVGLQALGPAISEPSQEVTHRSGGQAEGRGQTGGGLPLVSPLE
jgi:hypothetical protein